MPQYLVFNTEQEAIDAELHIRQLGQFPIVGVNALTLQPSQEGLTTAWAIPQQRLDGKWVFPVVPDPPLSAYADEESLFRTTHTFTIEDYQESWFPTGQIL